MPAPTNVDHSQHTKVQRLAMLTTNDTYITDLLNSSTQTWVTCDSVTMLYEALNTGAPVGIIELITTRRNNKLSKGIDALAKSDRVHLSHEGYSIKKTLSVTPPGKEISAVAKICLQLVRKSGT